MNYLDKLNILISRYENMVGLLHNREDIINEIILGQVGSYIRVAIWGIGEHTDELVKVLRTDKLEIVCFVDTFKGGRNIQVNGKKVLRPVDIKDLGIETIIISSYAFRNNIKESINKLNLNCNVVDFYEYYDIEVPFYESELSVTLEMYAINIINMYNDMRSLGHEIPYEIEENIIKISKENNINSHINKHNLYIINNNFNLQNCSEKCQDKIKVDFFIQYPQGWTSVESVYNAFFRDDKFEPRIVQIPYHYYKNKEYRDELREFFISHELPFIPWYFYDIDIFKPDIIIYQSPYDGTRPEEFKVENTNNKARIVYIPYGLEIGGGHANLERQFNLTIQNKAWLICSRSHRNKAMYKKYCDNGDNNVVVTGHPKIDAIYNLKEFELDKNLIKVRKKKKTFLWNPHFSIDSNENWSTFNTWKDIILDIFEEREDLFLIIRPHPALIENIKNEDEESIPGIIRFNNRINKMDNVYFDTNFDYRHSFAISDALISDASSFLLEYLPTYKPIMYLPNYEGPGLNDDGDIVNSYYIGNEREDMEKFVEMVSKGLDSMKDRRISKIEEYLYAFDGKVGKRIKEAVYKKYILEIRQNGI